MIVGTMNAHMDRVVGIARKVCKGVVFVMMMTWMLVSMVATFPMGIPALMGGIMAFEWVAPFVGGYGMVGVGIQWTVFVGVVAALLGPTFWFWSEW